MMFTNTNFLKLFFILLLLQTPLAEAAPKPVAQLKDFLASTKTLTANFKQVLYDEAGKVKQTSYGVFNLSRPGKFRWDYKKPFLQEIVSNSGKVWFYDADLEQVTIKTLDKSMGSTPALLLTGDVDIEKEFTIEKQGSEEGLQWVKLLPKNAESTFKYVLIGLNNNVLGGMELSDNFGQLTRIYFSDVILNPQMKADEFTFIIPKGVDVLEDKQQPKSRNKPQNTETVPEESNPELDAEADEVVDEAVVETVAPSKHRTHLKSTDKHKDTADKAKNTSKDKHDSKSKSDKHQEKSKDKNKDKPHDKVKAKEKSKDHKDKHK